MRPSASFVLALLLAALGVTPPASAARCDTDPVPAATLLVPYFQVDLTQPDGRNTLFSITNTEAEPVLANVVLWTDWAVPTLQFNVYLAGHDVQTFSLRDVLVHGRLPATGSAVSPHGPLSEAAVEFPGCNATTSPGQAPVYPAPALEGGEIERLQAFHVGDCHDGLRASLTSAAFEGRVARGYVTVDVVERCEQSTPANAGYFADPGVAGHRNALTGDYFLVDPSENFAQGELAVHIESFPEGFSPGDYTFYKRYVSGSAADGREPLGTQYSFRHLAGGAFDGGTRVVVWRDTGSAAAEPVACDGQPAWASPSDLAGYRVYTDEEDKACTDLDICEVDVGGLGCPNWPTGLATQLVTTSGAAFHQFFPKFPFGKTFLTTRELQGSPDPADWELLQGWVSITNDAEGRFSVGQRATRLDSACDPEPIQIPPDGLQDCGNLITGDVP